MEEVAQDICYGAGSVAGAVIGTFFTTLILLVVAALLYRQWRRHKGKHLVLVTDPEIVEDAYAFDNPCFKDATPSVCRVQDPGIRTTPQNSVTKDTTRWSTPWTTFGLGSGGRGEKKRALDDTCVGPKATRVSVVGLRSRDFTGLGFNVCGNMREGIFVKDLLHRGPASESGRIHPGDRITSVKISFRNMVYEDALTILSYASPYDVEIEVENGGSGSKPTTLLKKTVGPNTNRICHPLYRSQSIIDLPQAHKNAAKRLFIADPNESIGSNYSTMNSTMKSTKSTPGGGHSLERRNDDTQSNNYHKFGIKVLPALDGTVHRIENQNEHNTNLERRHSKKMDVEKKNGTSKNNSYDERRVQSENVQKAEVAPKMIRVSSKEMVNGIDMTDKGRKPEEMLNIPSEVPAEVHNAAMAARRNRKSSSELIAPPKVSPTDQSSEIENEGPKSPMQKNKRKAPAPPKIETPVKMNSQAVARSDVKDDAIDTIADYSEPVQETPSKPREQSNDEEEDVNRIQRLDSRTTNSSNRRNSESDTDSEVQNSFTTIELNSADITIHRTPVPDTINHNDEDENDIYRKAASLGDLSKYENKSLATLERAQSLDMTDASAKKRKAPMPPEDINESTEDLTKLDEMDTFDRRKLKKSSEWGTLEDAIWNKPNDAEDLTKISRTRKKSNGTLERSRSAVEIKLKEETPASSNDRLENVQDEEETSAELYNLPLSKRLTEEFIHSERMFNPDEDNALARIVNDGVVVKSPTIEEVELDFRQAKPLPDEEESNKNLDVKVEPVTPESNHQVTAENDTEEAAPISEDFSRALRYFEMHAVKTPTTNEGQSIKVNLTRLEEWKAETPPTPEDPSLYVGKKLVTEKPMTKIHVVRGGCRACEERSGQHDESCTRSHSHPKRRQLDSSPALPPPVDDNYSEIESQIAKDSTKLEESTRQRRIDSESSPVSLPTDEPSRTKSPEPIIQVSKRLITVNTDGMDEDDDYEFGSSITVNSKSLVSSPEAPDRHNVSNISVSSSENSEDSGLVRESIEYNPTQELEKPPLPTSPMPASNASQKMTYITEIKVSPNKGHINDEFIENNVEIRKPVHEITVTSNGKPTPGKKPPVPPRRSDMSKYSKDDQPEKQVVYVSEYKPSQRDATNDLKKSDVTNKKFEHWIFLDDNSKDQNPWGNGSSQPQQITNIMLSSGDEKHAQ